MQVGISKLIHIIFYNTFATKWIENLNPNFFKIVTMRAVKIEIKLFSIFAN